jgi:hypothetical protein
LQRLVDQRQLVEGERQLVRPAIVSGRLRHADLAS